MKKMDLRETSPLRSCSKLDDAPTDLDRDMLAKERLSMHYKSLRLSCDLARALIAKL